MIYENVKRLADGKGISIRALESQAGLKNGAIVKWRESVPVVTNLQAVAKVLEVTIEELLEDAK